MKRGKSKHRYTIKVQTRLRQQTASEQLACEAALDDLLMEMVRLEIVRRRKHNEERKSAWTEVCKPTAL